MSFLGKLFGTDAAAGKVIDNISAGVDKMFYTEEEKAGDNAAARTEGFAVYMEWLRGTSGSRVARRCLALGTFAIWSIEHLTAVTMRVASVWAEDPGRLDAAAVYLTDVATENNTLVGVVFAFYFGGPVLVDASAAMLKKWTGVSGK